MSFLKWLKPEYLGVLNLKTLLKRKSQNKGKMVDTERKDTKRTRYLNKGIEFRNKMSESMGRKGIGDEFGYRNTGCVFHCKGMYGHL